MSFQNEKPVIRDLREMFFSIKFLFPDMIEWVSYSDCLGSIYVGNDSGIMCIAESDWRNLHATSYDIILAVGAEVNLKRVYSNEVEEFDAARKEARAAWIEEGKVVIFDLDRETVECVFNPLGDEERYAEVHIDPFGRSVLSLAEIDKEEESFFLYEWRVLDIGKNEWIVLDDAQTTNPNAFLTWIPNGEEIIFYDEYNGITFTMKKDGSQKSVLNLISSPEMYIDSLAYSRDGRSLALCNKDQDGHGNIYVCSGIGSELRELAPFQALDINPDNISWSPLENWILFRDTHPSEPIMRLIIVDGKEIYGLFPVPVDYVEEPIVRWLSDGEHVFWSSDDTVNITRIVGSRLVPRNVK
jgi:hypothetical protein